MFLTSSCSCLCPIHLSQVLSWEWRCSLSSTNRWCSNYIWVISKLIAHLSVIYIRGLMLGFIIKSDIFWCREQIIFLNKQRPSNTYMYLWTRPSLTSNKWFVQYSAPEHCLNQCLFTIIRNKVLWSFDQKGNNFHSRKLIWNVICIYFLHWSVC